MPTYDWIGHQIYVPTLLSGQIGQQNLAMISRLNGPQPFSWNSIAQPDLVEFDPNDGDDDVLDAFAAMAMGAPIPAGNAAPPHQEPIIPHQAPAVPQNPQQVALPPQSNPPRASARGWCSCCARPAPMRIRRAAVSQLSANHKCCTSNLSFAIYRQVLKGDNVNKGVRLINHIKKLQSHVYHPILLQAS